MLFDKDSIKEMELDEQVENALDEKQKIADRQLFFCSHCGSKEVDVDFVSDDEDYLCECPNCGEAWTYSKEKFRQETRRQNRILAKAKRWWRWHGSNGFERFKIVMKYFWDFIGMLIVAAGFLAICMAAGGVL